MHDGVPVGAVITAAGEGVRMGGAEPKQFLPLEGKPVVAWAIEQFQNYAGVDFIIVTAGGTQVGRMREIVADARASKVCAVVEGGSHRQDSVRNGLRTLGSKGVGIVMVHDGVRPFVDTELIRAVLNALSTADAAIAAVPARDTVKLSDGGPFVSSTPSREQVWLAQTPQAFRYADLSRAFEAAERNGFKGTDEAALVEKLGKKVALVEGGWDNIKITTAEDMEIAGMIARRRLFPRRDA